MDFAFVLALVVIFVIFTFVIQWKKKVEGFEMTDILGPMNAGGQGRSLGARHVWNYYEGIPMRYARPPKRAISSKNVNNSQDLVNKVQECDRDPSCNVVTFQHSGRPGRGKVTLYEEDETAVVIAGPEAKDNIILWKQKSTWSPRS